MVQLVVVPLLTAQRMTKCDRVKLSSLSEQFIFVTTYIFRECTVCSTITCFDICTASINFVNLSPSDPRRTYVVGGKLSLVDGYGMGTLMTLTPVIHDSRGWM